MSERRDARLRRLALAGLLVAVALAFGAVAARAWPQMLDLIDYPYPVDYGEGVVLSQVEELREGGTLYPADDTVGKGFVGANYPPLYYLAVLLTPSLQASIYEGARMLSLASYALVGLLAGLLVARATRCLPAGVVAGMVFLALPPAREWGVFAKPDLLALGLSLAGLIVATLARPGRAVWAAPLFALALLTKQTAVVAPLAAGLWLLLTPGRRREAFALGGVTAVLILVPLVLLDLGPQAVFWHVIVANARGWAWDRFDDIGVAFLKIVWPVLAVAALLLPLAWRRRSLTPFAIYLPLALLSLLAAGLPGSSRNYALEAGLALAVAVGLVVGELVRSPRPWAAALVAGCLALLYVQAADLWRLPERTYGRRPPTAQVTRGYDNVLAFLEANGDRGPVLAENVGLLVQADVPIEYHDPSLMAKLAAAGTWDQHPLLDEIRQRHFAFILTEVNLEKDPDRAGRWTPEVVAAIVANYHVLHEDVLTIYAPRTGT